MHTCAYMHIPYMGPGPGRAHVLPGRALAALFRFVFGGVYPHSLYVVIAELWLTPVNLPQKIARGGRDLGGVYPP